MYVSRLKSMTADELKKKLDQREDVQIIDVREPYEWEICRLQQAELIPMRRIPKSMERVAKDRPVVLYCHQGMRSANIIRFMEDCEGYENLYALAGGIDAWARQVDRNMATY